jgi:hypothetical protein
MEVQFTLKSGFWRLTNADFDDLSAFSSVDQPLKTLRTFYGVRVLLNKMPSAQ